MPACPQTHPHGSAVHCTDKRLIPAHGAPGLPAQLVSTGVGPCEVLVRDEEEKKEGEAGVFIHSLTTCSGCPAMAHLFSTQAPMLQVPALVKWLGLWPQEHHLCLLLLVPGLATSASYCWVSAPPHVFSHFLVLFSLSVVLIRSNTLSAGPIGPSGSCVLRPPVGQKPLSGQTRCALKKECACLFWGPQPRDWSKMNAATVLILWSYSKTHSPSTISFGSISQTAARSTRCTEY